MTKLWDVPGQVQEVFYKAANYSVAFGTLLSETAPQQPGSKMVGEDYAQLTKEGSLTPAGQQYCVDYGVLPSADGLKKWAACKIKADSQKLPCVRPVL